MRLMRWVMGFLLIIMGFWAYHHFSLSQVAQMISCSIHSGIWDDEAQSCDVHAKQNCIAQGYQWDDVGDRCLIDDYQL